MVDLKTFRAENLRGELQGTKPFYSTNLNGFAREIMWYMTPEEVLKDIDFFLLHLMAKGTELAYYHCRNFFNFSDNDFIKALKNARPGIFIYEGEWLKWNKHFNINPPLPFPKKYK